MTSRVMAIVGAGPAGSMLAIYLARLGNDVTVYESRPDLRRVDIDAGRSINLALATRGMVALRDVGVLDDIEHITLPMRGRMVHDLDGGATLQRYGNTDAEVIHSVSRSDLNAVLLDAAEATGRVTIEFEMRCRSVDFAAGTLSFTDRHGATIEAEFDVVFGADGANSVVRDATVSAAGGTVGVDPLDHGYKELTLPPAPDGQFRLEADALHIWPRNDFMLIALPNPEGDFTVTLFMPLSGATSFAVLDDPTSVEKFFADEFPDFVPLVPDLADQFFANPTGELATVRCRGWSYLDRAVILGDAAHAVVPFHGQGMNAAFESCRVLDRHFRTGSDDLAAVFQAFEDERRDDTDAIATMALDNYVEMRAGVIDARHLLKRELALELDRRAPGRFIPRYAMVMFNTMPYAEAQRRAEAQGVVLDELTEGIDDIDQVDFERALALLDELEAAP